MPTMPPTIQCPRPLAALALCAALLPAAARAQAATDASTDASTDAGLASRVDRLSSELAALKARLAAQGTAPDAAAAAAEPPATVLTSYGELNYNRPTNRTQDTQADVRRFVLGYQHRFDERTRVVTELEVEHAVSSAEDAGEVELEQAHVERQLAPTWTLRGGLFLMPVGLLNENHEPTAFYGVERNFVETAIIPSTWREGGVQLIVTPGAGLTLQTGLSTGFDLNKWDAASTEGRESPLGSVHQELSLAKARDLSLFAAANWRGVPGLLLGGSVFSGGATQGTAVTSARVTLWDLHARWTPGRWDLSALVSRGTISGTAALNTTLVGNPTLIPAAFDGGYVQAAYQLWRSGDLGLAPFVRWERYNTASRYAELGAGLTPAAQAAESVATTGANLTFGNGLVLKADVQRFHRGSQNDRVDLGLGWSF